VYNVTVVILLQPLELISIRNEDEMRIRITVRLVGDLAQGDAHYIQFFNILMRKCLGHLELQLVGRNFFDAKAKVSHRSALIFIFSFFT
jgi:aubergine-like protein